jgi:ferredoxin-type protein NapH
MTPPTFTREQVRTVTQAGFYLLFLSAPLLNIFRFDVLEGHFIIFGHSWMLGIEFSEFECLDTSHFAGNILLNVILPMFVFIILFGLVSWKYGRIYCGWLQISSGYR